MSNKLVMDVSFQIYAYFYKAKPGTGSMTTPNARTQGLSVHYSIECYTSTKHYYFDKEIEQFVSEAKMIAADVGSVNVEPKGEQTSKTAEVKHSLTIPEGTTQMVLRFYGFTASFIDIEGGLIYDEIRKGQLYGRVSNLVISQADAGEFKDSTIISLYDETANVLINRSPALGPGPTMLSAKVIKNGMYLPESLYPSARRWNWPGDSFMTDLRVLIAQQHLLYRSRPNNLLTGTLVHEKKLLKIPSLWSFKDKNHILISGRLNYLTGYLEDVKLREYARWPELYPDDFYLQTEAGDNVLTEDEQNVLIAAQEYRFLMENGDQVKTEDDNYIKLS